MPRNTRMCQTPGRFLKLMIANRRASIRHVYFVPLTPMYFDRKSRTEGRLEMPRIAAEVPAMPAMVVMRVAADMLIERDNTINEDQE